MTDYLTIGRVDLAQDLHDFTSVAIQTCVRVPKSCDNVTEAVERKVEVGYRIFPQI